MTIQAAVGMRTARDLRSMLLEAAYAKSQGRHKTILCVLLKCGFTTQRLEKELAQFRSVIHENLAREIHVLALKSRSDLYQKSLPDISIPNLDAFEERMVVALADKPKSSSREAVVGMLLHRWINRRAPVTAAKLAELAGASIPTVHAALRTIDPSCLQYTEGRRIALSHFTASAWQQWLSLSTDAPTAKFVDRSGAPRSPEKLARLLANQGRPDVAIGGVLGAKHYFPELDLTAAPHLDIVVHGNMHIDLTFVEQLDPGLVRDDSMDAHAHVVVHFANRAQSLFAMRDGIVWADVLDCLVNLWDANLIHQVENLINHIAPQGLHEPLGD